MSGTAPHRTARRERREGVAAVKGPFTTAAGLGPRSGTLAEAPVATGSSGRRSWGRVARCRPAAPARAAGAPSVAPTEDGPVAGAPDHGVHPRPARRRKPAAVPGRLLRAVRVEVAHQRLVASASDVGASERGGAPVERGDPRVRRHGPSVPREGSRACRPPGPVSATAPAAGPRRSAAANGSGNGAPSREVAASTRDEATSRRSSAPPQPAPPGRVGMPGPTERLLPPVG